MAENPKNTISSFFDQTKRLKEVVNNIIDPISSLQKILKQGFTADTQKMSLATLMQGNMQKAQEVHQNLTQYSGQTAYEVPSLVKAQESLMGAGLAPERALETLKQIGDIALGDSKKIEPLATAFAKVTAQGKLQAATLTQMQQAGFNPLQVISERTGESMNSLQERMNRGRISARELAEAFRWATDAQGDFYQGAENVNSTLQGRFAVLMASIQSIAVKVYEIISPLLILLVALSTVVFSTLNEGFNWFIQRLQEGNPIILGIAAVLGVFITAITLHNTYMAIAAAWQNRLSWAVIKTNLAFLANPIVLIIAGIVALIAIITYCIVGVSGWGKAWDNTMQGMKYLWEAFILTYKAHWNTAVNAFMAGVDLCKLAWYKFKEAVGLGDSKENQAMISQIQNDLQERAKSVAEGYKKAGEAGVKAKEAFGKAWGSLEFKSLSSVKDGLMSKLGIGQTAQKMSPLATSTVSTPFSEKGNKTKDNIVTGGTRQTHINIQIGNLGTDTKVYVSSVREGVENFGERLKEELLRVVNSVNQMQTV
ncbi:hypothetical protein RCZ04_17030 [Capnocytophaga sp. HP1101]